MRTQYGFSVNLCNRFSKNKILCFLLFISTGVTFFLLQSLISINFRSESETLRAFYIANQQFYEEYVESVKGDNGTRELIELAEDINRKHGLVMITIINDAFLPFTFSWMCNTEKMNIHELIIYITTDWESKMELDDRWKDSKSVYIPSLNIHGNQEYSQVGYVKIMNLRTQLIRLMLLQNITVFLFETDCVWLSNPLPEIRSNLEPYDMLLVKPTRGRGVIGGFMVLKSTKATVSLWSMLSLQMWMLIKKIKSLPDSKEISKIENDQVYFSKLVKANYAHINVGFLSNKEFSDGKWYEFLEKERTEFTPIVINNNWIKGIRQKIQRAKDWGHWFLKDDQTCDKSQISKIVKF